ncbi:MAG: hypothetical protein N2Z22_10500, partial [Turneriella sp.]|nr:hypothetical protein [Turneriella sp.]
MEKKFFRAAKTFCERHTLLDSTDAAALWQALDPPSIALLEEGESTGIWRHPTGQFLHSPRDPLREARRAAANLKDATAVIAISCGAGWLLRALPEQVHSVLVIEPNPVVAAAFLLAGHHRTFAGKITLFVGTLDHPDALEPILPWLQGKNLKKTLIYCHAAALAADRATY